MKCSEIQSFSHQLSITLQKMYPKSLWIPPWYQSLFKNKKAQQSPLWFLLKITHQSTKWAVNVECNYLDNICILCLLDYVKKRSHSPGSFDLWAARKKCKKFMKSHFTKKSAKSAIWRDNSQLASKAKINVFWIFYKWSSPDGASGVTIKFQKTLILAKRQTHTHLKLHFF